MNDAEKAYQYFVIAVPENEEQAKAYFWARKALQPTLTQPNEWVSVENALPPNTDDVLVVVQNNGECWTVTGYYSNMFNAWYAMLNGQDTKMDVLWWMPLPAPPDRRPPEGEA